MAAQEGEGEQRDGTEKERGRRAARKKREKHRPLQYREGEGNLPGERNRILLKVSAI